MARLSYEERINRLETRLNDLVKPVFIIADSSMNGVEATTILSTGKKQKHHFSDYTEFERFAFSIDNCNILCNGNLLSFRYQELSKALSKATKEELEAIVDNKVDSKIIRKVVLEGITNQI